MSDTIDGGVGSANAASGAGRVSMADIVLIGAGAGGSIVIQLRAVLDRASEDVEREIRDEGHVSL